MDGYKYDAGENELTKVNRCTKHILTDTESGKLEAVCQVTSNQMNAFKEKKVIELGIVDAQVLVYADN